MKSEQWRADCLEFLAKSGATSYRVWREVRLETGRAWAFTSIRRALSGEHKNPSLDLASAIYRVCKGLAESAESTEEPPEDDSDM